MIAFMGALSALIPIAMQLGIPLVELFRRALNILEGKPIGTADWDALHAVEAKADAIRHQREEDARRALGQT